MDFVKNVKDHNKCQKTSYIDVKPLTAIASNELVEQEQQTHYRKSKDNRTPHTKTDFQFIDSINEFLMNIIVMIIRMNTITLMSIIIQPKQ